MTAPLNAIGAARTNPRPEPVLPVLPAVAGPAALPPTAQADRVREAATVERDKKMADVTPAQVSNAVVEINQSLKQASIGVQFEFDKEADIMVTKVVDTASGDVIRQMPSEEVVRLSKSMDKLQGLLVSQKV